MQKIISFALLLALLLQPISTYAQQSTEKKTQTARKPATAPAHIEVTSDRTIPIEELLPAATMNYFVTTSLAGLVENYRRLEAYKILAARLPKEEREAADNPLDQIANFLSAGISDENVLSETRIGLAFIAPELTNAQKQSLEEKNAGAERRNETTSTPIDDAMSLWQQPQYAIFVEAAKPDQARKAREQFISFYSEMFTDLGKPEEAKILKDPRLKTTNVEQLKNGFLGTFIGTTYVLGSRTAVEAVLKLQTTTGGARLSDDLDFVAARGQLQSSAGLFGYVNGKAMDELMQPLLKGMAGFAGPIFNSLLTPGAIKSIAISSSFERNGVTDRMIFALDQSKRNFFSTLFSGPALEFQSAKMIPAGTPILINHSLDFTKVYDDLIVPMVFGAMAEMEANRIAQRELAAKRASKTDAPKNEEEAEQQSKEYSLAIERARAETQKPEFTAKMIARYEREIGFKFREEIEKDLGNEVTVAVSIPPPPGEDEKKKDDHWAVFIGLRDREAMKTALFKLVSYTFGTAGMQMAGNSNPGETPAVSAEREDSDDEPPPPPAPAIEPKEKTDEELKKEQEQRLALMNMLPREKYKNAEIINVFAAVLAFTDEHLILADNIETIKRLVDNPENGTPVNRDPKFSLAMAGTPGSAMTRVFVGPEYFDSMLMNFVNVWSARPVGGTDAAPLNLASTAAGYAEPTDKGFRVEVYSPTGLLGLVGLEVFSSDIESKARNNEEQAQSALRTLAFYQRKYAEKNNGRFATMAQLAAYQKATETELDGKPGDEMMRQYKYPYRLSEWKEEKGNYKFQFKVSAGAKNFEAVAIPVKYGRNGRRSFFTDESGKLRGADKRGEPATASDELLDKESNEN